MDSCRICMTEVLKDDCLGLILEKLDTKTDRDCFGLTCHRFLDIENSSRKNLKVVVEPDSCSPTSMVDKLLNRFTELQSLNLSHCSADFTKLQYLSHYYGSLLHSLDLSYCDNLNDTGLASFASGCPGLSTICLCKSSSVTDYGFQTLTTLCPLLKRVDISWCVKITDLGISHLNRNCRQLTSLTITGCGRIRGESFHEFPSSMRSLEAVRCHLDYTCVSGVLSRGALECLNLSDSIFNGFSLEKVFFGFSGANFKILNFKLCELVTTEDVIKIAKGCPLLKEWNLSWSRGRCAIFLSGWESIASHCQNLEKLDINNCIFGDKALLTLGKGCSRLSWIDISDCGFVTDRGLQTFKTRRPDVVVKQQNKPSFFRRA